MVVLNPTFVGYITGAWLSENIPNVYRLRGKQLCRDKAVAEGAPLIARGGSFLYVSLQETLKLTHVFV